MGRRFEPMLAASGRPPTSLTGYAAEPKWDGWRATVEADGAGVRAWSRNNHELTDRVPVVQELRGQHVVLDGELIAGAGALEDFYRLFGSLAAKTVGAVTFVAFDVLAVGDETLVGLPYVQRRARLEALGLPGVVVTPSFPGTDLDALLAACDERGMEGVVLKRLRSVYRPGQRSADWRKVKCAAWAAHLERRRETLA